MVAMFNCETFILSAFPNNFYIINNWMLERNEKKHTNQRQDSLDFRHESNLFAMCSSECEKRVLLIEISIEWFI